MPKIVPWSEIAAPNGTRSKNGIRVLRLESGNTYVLRFVGNPLKFSKYFINTRGAICADPDRCPVRAKYGIDPAFRCAVNVLDRGEQSPECRLKILEVAESILEPIAGWARSHGIDPGGNRGCDFRIEVVPQRKRSRYIITALEPTPFTAGEKEYIKGNIYDLARLFRPVPANQIEERLFGRTS